MRIIQLEREKKCLSDAEKKYANQLKKHAGHTITGRKLIANYWEELACKIKGHQEEVRKMQRIRDHNILILSLDPEKAAVITLQTIIHAVATKGTVSSEEDDSDEQGSEWDEADPELQAERIFQLSGEGVKRTALAKKITRNLRACLKSGE